MPSANCTNCTKSFEPEYESIRLCRECFETQLVERFLAAATKQADVKIENHGSLLLFRPHTNEAAEWIRANTEGIWFGGALAVEPRYADHLRSGLEQYGFSVEI
jgi:hypothetical protein